MTSLSSSPRLAGAVVTALLVAAAPALIWRQELIGLLEAKAAASSNVLYPVRIALPLASNTTSAPVVVETDTNPETETDIDEDADSSGVAGPEIDVLTSAENRSVGSAPNRTAVSQNGVLPVEYNLARGGDSEGAIEVSKSLVLNGKNVAPLSVQIVGGATILVSRSDLLGRMKAANIELSGARMLPNVEHVSFRQLRDAGLEVRYDPVADAITLKAES